MYPHIHFVSPSTCTPPATRMLQTCPSLLNLSFGFPFPFNWMKNPLFGLQQPVWSAPHLPLQLRELHQAPRWELQPSPLWLPFFFLTPSFHSKSARVSPFAENISLTLNLLLTLQIPTQAWPPPPCPLTGQLPLPQAITAPHSPSPSSWWQFYIHMWLWRSLIIHFTNKNYRL